ncbi:imidazolonepropionase [Alkaliphilus metalliredigens QYMF]|uniref:Imidazolonepropionase n=1 Tax=Alkaliphilus metalliredigens (strain QYMF) TaxID=293826 RepID=HUTI_ALKMQ|nr:imidazolonepropionase [Alkaliphilus metalliredigens]A6TSW9.1 RecName: Full=Imidazolonepropionase; AltName: Full=Imidazolone-5-propionate hydrolase [Alkaliphilus metalliredigens QYMF]ABR49287.1 imidazolonepropionase [Alkaliphilus metalliredigens QYMF]
MMVDVLIKDISQMVTMKGSNGPRRGKDMREVHLIEDGWIAIKGDKIVAVGSGLMEENLKIGKNTMVIDGKGKTVTPGLVDPHTHLVHGGSRENELALKLNGVPYLDILAQGGGILSTVKATRKATVEELMQQGKRSLDQMLSFGVTTVEVKSGYGLNTETELKQLEVIRQLNKEHPCDLVPTFMGAHAIPMEYKEDPDVFVDIVIDEMLPAVVERGLAEFCDVFCEKGVFTVAQSRRVLEAAREAGLKLRIHVDEIEALGGAELAAEMGAITAEHLMVTSEEDMKKMAKAGVIAALLPGTSFNLMVGKYAQARKMIDYGVPITLSTDYNPGSCPTENIQFIMTLGCLAMKMTPEEVFTAVTINGAAAVDRQGDIGSLEVGKKADVVIFNAPNINYIPYHFGINHVDKVLKNGKLVVDKGRVI